MNKFAKFQERYDEAIANIESYLADDGHRAGMAKLAEWLLTTDANPYSYLPHEWAESVYTAEGISGLLDFIDHALYDDGDITFVKVNAEPRIVFAHRFDADFNNECLTETEKDIRTCDAYRKLKTMKIEVEVLDIKPEEFGPIYDAYQLASVKGYFMNDAENYGVEWAADHYRKYRCWNEAWIEEFKANQ